jgi:hypothetical protein
MPLSLDEVLPGAVERTIAANSDVVDEWINNEPGAWGSIAGRCLIACREGLGRSLTDSERRAAWQDLWDKLLELREARGA